MEVGIVAPSPGRKGIVTGGIQGCGHGFLTEWQFLEHWFYSIKLHIFVNAFLERRRRWRRKQPWRIDRHFLHSKNHDSFSWNTCPESAQTPCKRWGPPEVTLLERPHRGWRRCPKSPSWRQTREWMRLQMIPAPGTADSKHLKDPKSELPCWVRSTPRTIRENGKMIIRVLLLPGFFMFIYLWI